MDPQNPSTENTSAPVNPTSSQPTASQPPSPEVPQAQPATPLAAQPVAQPATQPAPSSRPANPTGKKLAIGIIGIIVGFVMTILGLLALLAGLAGNENNAFFVFVGITNCILGSLYFIISIILLVKKTPKSILLLYRLLAITVILNVLVAIIASVMSGSISFGGLLPLIMFLLIGLSVNDMYKAGLVTTKLVLTAKAK